MAQNNVGNASRDQILLQAVQMENDAFSNSFDRDTYLRQISASIKRLTALQGVASVVPNRPVASNNATQQAMSHVQAPVYQATRSAGNAGKLTVVPTTSTSAPIAATNTSIPTANAPIMNNGGSVKPYSIEMMNGRRVIVISGANPLPLLELSDHDAEQLKQSLEDSKQFLEVAAQLLKDAVPFVKKAQAADQTSNLQRILRFRNFLNSQMELMASKLYFLSALTVVKMKGQLEVAVKSVSDAFDAIRKEEQRAANIAAGKGADEHPQASVISPKDDAAFIEDLLKSMNKQHLLADAGSSVSFTSNLAGFAVSTYNSPFDA